MRVSPDRVSRRSRCTLRPRRSTQMAIKELDHYAECVLRFRNVCVVKESVKEPFPYVEFSWHIEFHHLLVRVESRAQLKTSSPGNNERRRELRQDLRRADRRKQRVLRISIGEVAERRPCSGLHRRCQTSLAERHRGIERVATEYAARRRTEN